MASTKTPSKSTAATKAPLTRNVAKPPAAKPAAAPAAKPAAPAAKRADTNPAAMPAAAEVASTKIKHKLVRDSFTIPKDEYAVLAGLKQRGTQLARAVKKGEILRAGIAALQAMPDQAFLSAINAVPSLKTGRPKDTAAPAKKSSPKK